MLALATIMTGCSTISSFLGGTDNTEPPAELIEFEPTLVVQELWSRSVGAGAGKTYLRLDPVLFEGTVFAAGARGNVAAFDAVSGERKWAVDTELEVGAGPGVGENLVLIGSLQGVVVAMDAGTGEERWRSRLSSEVLSSPVIFSGVVIARAGDGRIHGLNATDGSRVWVNDRAVPALTLRGTSKPVVVEGAAIAGMDGGQMLALEVASGKELWETRVAIPRGRSELERMVDIDGDPLLLGQSVYVATFQGEVVALDLYSGEVSWRRNISSHDRLDGDASNVYVTDDEGAVWALQRDGGASMWRQDRLARRAVTGPAAYRDWVAVGDYEGYVHWLRRDDGQFVARTRVDSAGVLSPPLAGPEAVYVFDRDGTLTAFAVPPPG